MTQFETEIYLRYRQIIELQGVGMSVLAGGASPAPQRVRIEDMLYLTEDGCENLTKAPKELIVL